MAIELSYNDTKIIHVNHTYWGYKYVQVERYILHDYLISYGYKIKIIEELKYHTHIVFTHGHRHAMTTDTWIA